MTGANPAQGDVNAPVPNENPPGTASVPLSTSITPLLTGATVRVAVPVPAVLRNRPALAMRGKGL